LPVNEATEAALVTCHHRGWVEPIYGGPVPTGELRFGPDGPRLPDVAPFNRLQQVYRLTDSGWAEIRRRDRVAYSGLFLAAVTVVIAAAAFVLG
jgi:hypothetical protein